MMSKFQEAKFEFQKIEGTTNFDEYNFTDHFFFVLNAIEVPCFFLLPVQKTQIAYPASKERTCLLNKLVENIQIKIASKLYMQFFDLEISVPLFVAIENKVKKFKSLVVPRI